METKLVKSKSQLELTLKNMEESQKGKDYKEADKCWKEIQRLKTEIFKLEGQQLKKQQKNDISEISKLQSEEKEAFHQRWNQTFEEMTEEIQAMRKQLGQKQDQEKKKLIQEFEEDETYVYSESGNVIALERKELTLAKQHNFSEAHETQEERKKLQAKERAEFEKEKKGKKKYLIKKLRTKHENEKRAMELKIISKLEEFKINKEKEEQSMVSKHSNVIREFRGEQQKQNLHHSGRFTSKGGNFDKLDSTTSRLKSATARSAKKFEWLKTKE